MTALDKAVTYKGSETPFVDRIYRSRLTFHPGQTRLLPALLAAKLLRHADVFEAYVEPTPEAHAVPAAVTPPPAATEGDKTAAQTPADSVIADDTAQQLEAAKKAEDDQRQQEDARFTLLQQIDKMDKQALRDWAKQTYQQELPGNLGLDKMRDRVRGFIDQFGAL